MLLRSVTGRSIFYRFLGDTLGKLVSFLVVVTIAREMGAAATGIYALANVLAEYVSVIPDLGMNLFVTREIAAGKVIAERLVGALLLVKIVASAGLLVVAAIVIPFFFYNPQEAYTALIMTGANLCFGVIEFFGAVLRGCKAINAETTLLLFFRIARAVAGVSVILLYRNLILLALAVAGVTLIAALAVAAYVARRYVAPRLQISWSEMRGWMGQYLPIGGGLVGTLLYFRSDLFIIRIFRTPYEVGFYDAAYRTFDGVQTIPAVILAVLYPKFAAGETRYFWRALRAVEIFAVVLMVAAITAGPAFIRFAYGRGFLPSAPILKILFLALPMMFANAVLTNYLVATRRQWGYTLATTAALFFSVSANFWAVPKFGIEAAAVVTLVTQSLILLVCLVCFQGMPPGKSRQPALWKNQNRRP
ncbi:MAG TPA: oligosaccharide flippase family protein [Acidobacteriota bacterium]